MPGAEDWQAFAGVVAVLIFLSAGAVGLKKLGIIGRPAAAETGGVAGDEDMGKRLRQVEREIAELRLCMAENYVRRDDYVTNESRVIGLLEKHSIMLARLEERIGTLR